MRHSVQTAEPETGRGPAGEPRPRRRRVIVAATVVVAACLATGGVLVVTGVVTMSHPGPVVLDNGTPTSTATVIVRDLSSRTSVSGTIGYDGSYTAINHVSGTYTWLPAPGQVIRQGKALYYVDGSPVVLLYGSIPAYRTLEEGVSDGPDVRQLNADLVALGYATSSELGPSSETFSSATATALEQLQSDLGVTQNGVLTFGNAVFLPRAARVVSVTPTVGASAQAGSTVLTASSTRRVVEVNLPAAEQTYVRVGDRVGITLPDNSVTTGRVTGIGAVASSSSSSSGSSSSSSSGSGSSNGSSSSGSSSSATVSVEIAPTRPSETGTWDQAPVTVEITTATASHALVVPVNALVALAGGGYAVEVVEASGSHRLVPVTPGLYDDTSDEVAVSGAGLAAGMRVVVPSL